MPITTKRHNNETKPPDAVVAAAAATATAIGGHNDTTKNSTSLGRTENLVDDNSVGGNASSSTSLRHRNDSFNVVQTEDGQESSCPPIPPSLGE